MKVLVTGGHGMLARALAVDLIARRWDVVALGRAELDVTDGAAVRHWVQQERPDAVVQCAAYTAVDAAEEDEAGAWLLNASATSLVAEACQEIGALLVYPSTDYVFSGEARVPYVPAHPREPLSAYGRSKAAGEQAALAAARGLVVRTSWLYGPEGKHFVGTMLRLAEAGGTLRVVHDQIGRPTSTTSLASIIGDLVARGAEGIFHATDSGTPVSWYEFAREILRVRGLPSRIEPVATVQLPGRAARPPYSVLDCTATEAFIGRAIPDWKTSLQAYLELSPPVRDGAAVPARSSETESSRASSDR